MRKNRTSPMRLAGTILALMLAVTYGDSSAQQINFKFNPPDSITFLQNLKATTDTDMGALGKRAEVTESQARITILKNDAGHQVIITPLSVSSTLNGQPVDNPIVSLMQNIVVQYQLDKEGQIDSISGYEELMRLMQSMLPPEALQSVASIFSPEVLASRDKAEWNGRIGSFIGRRARIGEAWTRADSFSLPSGQNIKFFSVVKFPEKAKCGEGDCVRVEYRYDSDGAALMEFAGKAAGDLARVVGDTAHDVQVSGGEITGQGERLINPATMLIHSENMSRTIKTKMNIPGQGEIDINQSETRQYTYDYSI